MAFVNEHVDPTCRTLRISGQFDLEDRHTFSRALDRAIQAKSPKVIFDLSRLTKISFPGLGLFLRAHEKLKAATIQDALEICPGAVLDIIKIAELDKKIPTSLADSKAPPQTTPKSLPPSASPRTSTVMLESDEMESLLRPIFNMLDQKTIDLPTLPEVARQVLSLTSDPHATAECLTNVINQDPVLMAKIFQTANSAAYGASRKIESLQQAISWLGLSMLEALTIALSLQGNLFNDRGYKKEVRGLWAHAIATAFYGKMLSRLIRANADTAFLCGLLHSIGKLVVIHHFAGSPGASTTPLRWSIMLSILEELYIQVGQHLAVVWNFPAAVKEAITCHQDHAYHLATHPSKGAAITCLASHLAKRHLESKPVSVESIKKLSVVADLKIMPEQVVNEVKVIQSTVQTQIESLLV